MNTPHYPDTQSPIGWLWQEIERRFGATVARELYAGYLLKVRERNYRRTHMQLREEKRPNG